VRVSSDRRAVFYRWDALVLLWGRWQPFAVEADSDEGWVDVRDLEALERGEITTKRLVGRVEIVLP
jgi:hypothetical protein